MNMQSGERKPGRPRSSEKHDRIIEAAEIVFRDEGFAASMDRIAALAGVSKQTVYTHFGSKEDLYRAVNGKVRWFGHEMFAAGLPVDETLKSFAVRMLEKLTSPDVISVHRLMIAQAGTFPDLARLHDQLGPSRSVAALAGYLAMLMERGDLRKDDPEFAAEFFFGAVQGLIRQRLLFGSRETPSAEEIESRVDGAVKAFLRAYGARTD